MAIKLFGFKIGKDGPEQDFKSFVPKDEDDGSVAVASGGVYGTYIDLEGSLRTDYQLVNKYREMAMQPECDVAVDDIVNEAIVYDEEGKPVEIVLEHLKQPQSIKNKIRDEFQYILQLLDFGNTAYDTFRRWYVDGRIYYHLIIDEKNPRLGLQELRYIDPRKIRKVRVNKKETDKSTAMKIYKSQDEYFVYSEKGFLRDNTQGIKISSDSVCYSSSGLLDKDGKVVISHLHKAIKPLNQLRMLEDATVIYRISRAPERRIFYIDVGNLPKIKAEQYLRDVMTKYKNKLVYDAQTGEIRDDRRFQTMLEDFWLPRREGGRSTEISTLPGGQNLGEMEDVLYFQKKVYKALNVPSSRLEQDNGFSLGRTSEITRDELKFQKFIDRLRLRFTIMFDNLMETHLVLKGICTKNEWRQMKENINYDFISDTHFTELKESEIMRERLAVLSDADNYVGKYFSTEYIRKHVLHQSEDEMKQMDKQMKGEEPSDEPSQQSEPKSEPETEPENNPEESNTVQQIEQTKESNELAKSMVDLYDDMLKEK
tara:strand:- start:1382 stop:3001 length:1620 start_codon:yes stop_codon:yes gene_type:complete